MTTLAELIDDFVADMRDHRQLRPNTLHAYQYDLHLATRFLTSSLNEITLAQLEQFVASNDAKPSTRARRYLDLSFSPSQSSKATL